jgi:hypothetical protein
MHAGTKLSQAAWRGSPVVADEQGRGRLTQANAPSQSIPSSLPGMPARASDAGKGAYELERLPDPAAGNRNGNIELTVRSHLGESRLPQHTQLAAQARVRGVEPLTTGMRRSSKKTRHRPHRAEGVGGLSATRRVREPA